MRRANGTGSIFKVKDKNRRNKWRVRITRGWEVDVNTGKAKQIIQTLGYYPTRADAEAALVAYNDCPYDIKEKDITFKDLYEMWSEGYFKELEGVSSERTIISAFKYCHSLYNMRMRDIRVYHLEECMNTAYVISTRGKDKGEKRYASAETKARMKSMFNLMFDYAYARDIVDRNYARAYKIDKKLNKQRKANKGKIVIFSEEEIKTLWDSVGKIKFADMIVIGIYSGWRPQELAILKIKDIDLEEGVMFGGMKTDAGKNRCVPIHPAIRELVVNRYNEAVELGSEYLFNDIDGQQGTYMTYDKYRGRFKKVMERLGMTHHPHETRHTFITRAKRADVDEYILKRIVGHSIPDITENVYTQREIKELINGMNKIPK